MSRFDDSMMDASHDAATTPPTPGARRPIRARGSWWAAAATEWLVRRRVSPNLISLGSVAFAAVAGVCFYFVPVANAWWGQSLLLLAAAACIQGRLVCNLLDGMVAVEGRLGGKTGELFNDLPDRPADILILVGAGYAARTLGFHWHAVELGWLAGAMAVMTAYVRVLGKSVGAQTYFLGPMAKQHRMAVMTGACVLAVTLTPFGYSDVVIWASLAIIVVGCLLTVARRLRRIFADMEAR